MARQTFCPPTGRENWFVLPELWRQVPLRLHLFNTEAKFGFMLPFMSYPNYTCELFSVLMKERAHTSKSFSADAYVWSLTIRIRIRV